MLKQESAIAEPTSFNPKEKARADSTTLVALMRQGADLTRSREPTFTCTFQMTEAELATVAEGWIRYQLAAEGLAELEANWNCVSTTFDIRAGDPKLL